MPATRVTVASNANRSLKAPLLIPSSATLNPEDKSSCRTLVFKTAQSKLRLKKPARIFIAKTGKELATEDDWKVSLKDDAVLLVSAGEDYVGAKKDDNGASSGSTPRNENNATTHVLADGAYVEPLAVTQLQTTAQTLPGILYGVAQPDLHPGTKFPIGAVFVSKGWIHPPLIGGDIGCGMAWYKTKLSPSQVDGSKGQRVAESLRGVEGAWRSQNHRLAWLSASSSTEDTEQRYSAGSEFDASLGTIGAGNHFAELQVVEDVSKGPWQDANKRGSAGMLQTGEVVLLVHSGSRGYGGDILKRYSDTSDSMEADSPRAKEYLDEHDRACGWADRNRDLIALRFLACLEPGESAWDLGLNTSLSSATSPYDTDEIRAAYAAVQSRKVVEICHNNMARARWPASTTTPNPTDTNTTDTYDDVFIHRKGAAPIHPFTSSQQPPPSTTNNNTTANDTTNNNALTLLPLPGSRGTPTLILSPTSTPKNNNGLTNALSLAHGAGRAMSRAKALASLPAKHSHRAEDILRGDYARTTADGTRIKQHQYQKQKLEGDDELEREEARGRLVSGGTWVVCEDKQLVWEEAPEAYKDVWDVGRDLVSAGAAERVGWCRGVVSYKVRKE